MISGKDSSGERAFRQKQMGLGIRITRRYQNQDKLTIGTAHCKCDGNESQPHKYGSRSDNYIYNIPKS